MWRKELQVGHAIYGVAENVRRIDFPIFQPRISRFACKFTQHVMHSPLQIHLHHALRSRCALGRYWCGGIGVGETRQSWPRPTALAIPCVVSVFCFGIVSSMRVTACLPRGPTRSESLTRRRAARSCGAAARCNQQMARDNSQWELPSVQWYTVIFYREGFAHFPLELAQRQTSRDFGEGLRRD